MIGSKDSMKGQSVFVLWAIVGSLASVGCRQGTSIAEGGGGGRVTGGAAGTTDSGGTSGSGGAQSSGGTGGSGAAGATGRAGTTGEAGRHGTAGSDSAAGSGGRGGIIGAGGSTGGAVGGTGGGSGSSGAAGTSGGAGTGGSNSGSPQIVSATTDISTLSTDNVVTITVVATDPDGLADLAGGNVVHPGGGTYGALEAGSTAGSFSLALVWTKVNSVSPINTEGTKAAPRTLEIQIFDREGNRATTTLTIMLHCSAVFSTACAGNCSNINNNDFDCGITCDNRRACTAPATCENGVCM